jgi:hypothetical protein
MNRTLATTAIALGLILALAGGILFASGHGLDATLCVMGSIAFGIVAFRQPV